MNIDISQLEYIHPHLRLLAIWLERETGFSFTITSQYRIDDTGVHGTLPLRGLDLRCRNLSIGKAVESFINENWQYDPSRPEMQCCKLHGDGANLHLHLQVHQNTRMR